MIDLFLSEQRCQIQSSTLEMDEVAFSLKKGSLYSSCLIISDEAVFSLYGETLQRQLKHCQLPYDTFLIPSGERAKTLKQATKCWEIMHRKKLDRETLIIGMGGGIVTDLTGFISSCYMRGLDCFYLPTTLLGMIDASIGGKTGVNLPSGKNIIGTFHHPKRIFIIPECLKTLSQKEMRSGIAEMIKYGVIQDAQFFEFVEKNLTKLCDYDMPSLQEGINTSCSIKANIVRLDPNEQGLRAILNYGHTFGHAIETETHYQTYLHGEAVAIGMNCAAHVSLLLGYIDQATLERQKNLCHRAGLPTSLPENISIERLIDLMKGDKKSKLEKINLIVPEKIGKVITISNIDLNLLRNAMNAARKDNE